LQSEEIYQYYLVAEGKKTALVLPARSGKEWFTVDEVEKEEGR